MDIRGSSLIERRGLVTGEHSIIPMINVVFLILIFFMISGSFQKLETEGVGLPISESNQPLREQEAITLERSGLLWWRGQKFPINGMDAVLKQHGWQIPKRIVVVTYRDIESKHVINLIDALRNTGAKSLSLVTTTERHYAGSKN